ncbi:MAG: DNA gyrase inhibitor YacG, partial [Planctomycetes bacterium]|nr:DNA gyrase inhibitor YacG [Planctomycetota bacterium]
KRCKMVDLGRWLDGTYCISDPITPTGQLDDEANETT